VTFESGASEPKPGTIVMSIRSCQPVEGKDFEWDPDYQTICVFINARPDACTFAYPEGTSRLELHPGLKDVPHMADVSCDDARQAVNIKARTIMILCEAHK
jgi:hypothetical protein